MSVLKKSFQINFTQVPNFIINDKNVSLKAKGLYLYMVSKPDDWEFSLSGMELQLKECKDSILSILDELIRFGYLTKIKRKNSDGTNAVNDYILHLEPETSQNPSKSTNPTRKNRLGKTDSEKSTTSNTINNNKEEIINTTLESERENFKDFKSFKKAFVEKNKNRFFNTRGIGYLETTLFTISDGGYIVNCVSNKYLEQDDAFKVWQYLYKNHKKDI